jgi:hypothetical protein
MEINQQFRRNVRTFYAWIGSMVILCVAPVAASRLIEHGTTWSRALGVIVGVSGFLPWLALVFVIIRGADEVMRRIHLIAIAIAATFGLLAFITIGWLVHAWFIEPPDFAFICLAWMLVWLIALLATQRYYERAR